MNNTSSNEEQWRDIPGFEGIYQVSDRGNIRSLDRVVTRVLKGQALKPLKHPDGHLFVKLFKNNNGKTISIHQLVMLAFRGPPPKGYQVRHIIDPNPANNALWNLEYGTPQDNSDDAVRHGTTMRGERAALAKLNTSQIVEIKKALDNNQKPADLARKYNVSATHISAIKYGKSWKWLTMDEGI